MSWLRLNSRRIPFMTGRRLDRRRRVLLRFDILESRDTPTLFVTSAADNGANTLRAAINAANLSPGTDTIAFAIGNGPQSIVLSTPLPTLTSPALIFANSQPG